MKITKKIADKIDKIAKDEAMGFYIIFEDEESEFNDFDKFLAYLKKHDELPEGSDIWEPFDYMGADIEENIQNHHDHIQNILTKFAEEIGTVQKKGIAS